MRAIMLSLVASLLPALLAAVELPAGRFRAATLREKPAAADASLLERLEGEVGVLEIEHVGDETSLVRSGGQILWLERQDEATATFSGSWTEGPEAFTRRIVIPFHAEDGVRIGAVIDEWSAGRRVERILLLIGEPD